MKRLKPILSFLYDFIGLRYIWSMIRRPIDKETGKRQPITFFLWLIGLYVALFGIASQRYENRVDLIEIRISSVFTQLSTPLYKRAFSRIAETQRLSCPLKPDIKNPISVYQSFFKDAAYFEGVDLLKATVENWKDSLSRANLIYADLSWANLRYADLIDAYLINANLSRAYLIDAYLRLADLSYADLRHADLSGADLSGADFSYAILDSTDFFNVLELVKDQLSESYYIDYPPINLPEGIDPPKQITLEEWKKLYFVGR